jgi:spermidine synthase
VDAGGLRALRFLGDSDLDVVETLIDPRQPHVLQHAYARTAMGALLYAPEPESGLLIGLGGGAMVRFLNHHLPRLRLEVVEIDPAVVRVAREYFGTVESPGTRFHVADGREFLARGGARYDLILIDAHLHPDERTDASGHPLSLRGAAFYRSVRERLSPGGVAMFNMLRGRDAETWLGSVRQAFAATHVYRPAGTGNLIVFAADRPLPGDDELLVRARAFDRRGGYGFSFEQLLAARAPDR